MQLVATFLFFLPTTIQAEEVPVYIETYTQDHSEGIYLLGFDIATGNLTLRGFASESENPSFLAMHQNGKHLYAVNETASGEISAFEINLDTQN